jgi:hypothetical protein
MMFLLSLLSVDYVGCGRDFGYEHRGGAGVGYLWWADLVDNETVTDGYGDGLDR